MNDLHRSCDAELLLIQIRENAKKPGTIIFQVKTTSDRILVLSKKDA